MTSTIGKLVYMANQIATALSSQQPGRETEATYDHIVHFWDPRMRTMIVAHLAAGGEGLGPVARAAVERLAASSQAAQRAALATDVTQQADSQVASDGG